MVSTRQRPQRIAEVNTARRIDNRSTPASCRQRLIETILMNIIEQTDEEILAVAHPMWEDLIRYSNEGEYGKFIRKFSYELLFGLNEVEIGKQFAKSELTRSLDSNYDYLGLIRRGQHVTVLYRVRSTKKEGEWLGRMVLGYEKDNKDDEVKIFGASIF
jgi:hypothetical protein